MSDLFISYAHEQGGFGNFVVKKCNPPRNEEEVKLVESELKTQLGIVCVILNWKVMK